MADLHGQTAIVTGASRGIGLCISRQLAAAGATVFLAARGVQDLERAAEELRTAGGSVFAVPTDISAEGDVEALFAAVREQGRLDILVNNAGIGVFGHVVDLAVQEMDRALRVNVRGTFLCCRAAMKAMIPQRRGTIINIASVIGFKGYPNQGAYTASKHAVMGLTKSLAVEAQEHGIRVSAVLPGAVYTDLAAAARPDLDPAELLWPEDVADAVLYLLSLSERAAVDQIYIRRRNSSPF